MKILIEMVSDMVYAGKSHEEVKITIRDKFPNTLHINWNRVYLTALYCKSKD